RSSRLPVPTRRSSDLQPSHPICWSYAFGHQSTINVRLVRPYILLFPHFCARAKRPDCARKPFFISRQRVKVCQVAASSGPLVRQDRKSTRLNSSNVTI